MECEHYERCLNNSQCYRCTGYNLLKVKQVKKTTLRRVSPKKPSTPWKKLEHQVAQTISKYDPDTKLQPGSGNKWFAPGDVKSSDFLVECKSHVAVKGAKQHTVTKEQLEKIEAEAFMTGRLPLYAFQFKGDSRVYVILELNLFEELLQSTR